MSPSILLVEPGRADRNLFEEILQAQGYRVSTACDGRGAIELCASIRPDLVLLEISLPDSRGEEVCRQLKADPKNRLTPVVLFGANAATEEKRIENDGGADGVVSSSAGHPDPLQIVRTLLAIKTYVDAQAESVLLSLARSIEARDPCTVGHCERLSALAARLGARIKMTKDEVAALRVAGIVHDVGKVAVPDCILLKPGELTPEEMDTMKVHPVVGEQICAPLKSFREVLPIVRHHHERMDGSGYPDGLLGEEIPLAARVLRTVDIFDALTSERPYRGALPRKKAFELMREECRRGWSDPELVSELQLMMRS